MRCPSCGFDNPKAMRFCIECGVAMSRCCPQCGSENPPQAKFCGACAAPLLTQSPVRSGDKPDVPDAERRQLTVLFCDLVGSTALSGQLDPEDLREVVRTYQAACLDVIRRFEGHPAQLLGDGVLVYFGYPVAHEDDAQRAVRTGLGILEAIHTVNARSQDTLGVRLAVRIGVHTGVVVIGEIGGMSKRELLALGQTPNLAARLQGIAEPDTVVISGTTHRLIHGLFTCQDRGVMNLSGVSAPVSVYRVLAEGAAQSRFEAAVATGLTPLVGREQQVGLLLERWEQVTDGLGQVVLLVGEPGIGKSRLVQEVRGRLSSVPYIRLECRCSPYYRDSPLYPVIDLLRRVCQFQRDEPPEERFWKLESTLREYDVPLPDIIPLLTFLLTLPLPGPYAPLTLTPERQRQKTLEALVTLLLAMTAQRPVVLTVEDLHWVDPTTLELVTLLIDHVATGRILTLLTARPEFRPPWAPRSHVIQLTLNRLTRKQTELMVLRVAGGMVLPPDVLQVMATKTDGVPLFVEELTKTMLESGLLREKDGRYELRGPIQPVAIPDTLQDSLMARLDRLAMAKEVAQLGATLGRAFPYELLQAVSALDEAALQHALEQLVEADLLYKRGLPPRTTYLFKHALIQEVAYQSLLKSTRQRHHGRIAQVLETQFPETAETQPELLAHHFTEAGHLPQAIGFWHRAGQRALERSAAMEAITHLTKGLHLLEVLPETAERSRQELDLQFALGPSLIWGKGYAAPEVERAYSRALELCRMIGEPPQLFTALFGMYSFYLLRAEIQKARGMAEQCLDLAERVQDPELLLEAHSALGQTLFYLGEFAAALNHLEQGIVLYDRERHGAHAFRYGEDPGVGCRVHAAWALWHLGYPDRSLTQATEATALASELKHPHDQAYALGFAAAVHAFRGEPQLAQERAEAMAALATEQGMPMYLAMAAFRRGCGLAAAGSPAEGIHQMRDGLSAWRATGAELESTYRLSEIAKAHAEIGDLEAGFETLVEGLALAQQYGERFHEAELHRLRGEFLRRAARENQNMPGDASPLWDGAVEAADCFRRAIDVARQQNAKSLELRATLSLSRLWLQQGKQSDARAMLAECLQWFAEGFDTADLTEAKKLLEAMT